jgi:TolA-binding protein
MTHKRCPSEPELSEAFTHGGDDALYEHLAACSACSAQWESWDELRELASALSFPTLDDAQVESTRASLLTRVETDAPVRRVGRRVSYVIPALAAVAAILLVSAAGLAWWASGSETQGSAAHPEYLATIHAQDDARYARVSGAPNEIVRLHQGRVTVAVEKLAAGQRLRVLTGDAEVEVRGTVFDVEARDDVLVLVRVIEGVVEVRRGGTTTVLQAGERWDVPLEAAARVPVAPPVGGAEVEPVKQDSPQVAGGMGDDAKEDSGDKSAAANAAVPVRLVDRRSAQAGPRRVAAPGPKRRKARRAQRNGASAGGSGNSEARLVPGDAAPSSPARVAPEPALEPALEPGVEVADEKNPPARDPQPTAAERHFQEGWRAFEAGDHAAAAAAFAQVGDKEAGGTLSSDALFWRAVALDRAGHSAQAESALAAYLKSWPRSRRSGAARAMLGWKRLRAGDAGSARLLFGASLNDPSPKVRRSAQAGIEAADAKLAPAGR